MTRVPPDQQRAFLAQILPPAAAICPQYGLDPKQCVAEAADWSSWGRFAVGHNWWGLGGVGDAGYYSLLRPVRTYTPEGGGWASEVERIAKFSTPTAAVQAWCETTLGVAP